MGDREGRKGEIESDINSKREREREREGGRERQII